jgi:hypothetical protein
MQGKIPESEKFMSSKIDETRDKISNLFSKTNESVSIVFPESEKSISSELVPESEKSISSELFPESEKSISSELVPESDKSISSESLPESDKSISSESLPESEKSLSSLKGDNLSLTYKTSSEKSIQSMGGAKEVDVTRIVPLTGKAGLESCMNFIDTKSPPEKGGFSYKSEKYGRIFSQEEIGKYSAKIKTICERIMTCQGVALIYSEFLDGALIPMALSLEELGFTRASGGKGKSLFKDSPPVKAKNLHYVMITGDPRISPDNDDEVKMVTSDNNMYGEKIKVILISKAGSEGVDFKFIRQVHILEPWYNMNRIEQIIGRAVRNFSHKNLPFEKRNVEIYLYGTLLERSKEESADLYVYRVAEYKAVQMGRVTRLLKETAVDCIINHEQVNFTQENMNTTVEQILSDGKKIENFKVGDIPGTASCDYMDTCNFQCRPFKRIEEDDILQDTYDESFILINSDKIIQKIRSLMKDRFFYKKDDLMKRINFPKDYPLVQIYAALSQLVEDDNEFIVDKYGRNGRLVNIGDYYIFQPIELNYPENSIFDQSVPVDFKHENINFEIKESLTKAVTSVKQSVLKSSEVLLNPTSSSIETLKVKEMKENYNTTIEYIREGMTAKSDDSWYKHCGIAIRKMIEQNNIPREILVRLVVDHIVDMLTFDEKIEFLDYISGIQVFEPNSFEEYAKQYIDTKVVNDKGITGILLYDPKEKKVQTFILDSTSKTWKIAEYQDKIDLNNIVKQKYTITKENLNSLLGFIDYEQKNQYLVFKVKSMEGDRNTGAQCRQAPKHKQITTLNKILGEEVYGKTNTKGLDLCCVEELTMRYYDKERKDGKVWFLEPDAAKIYKF